MTVGTLVSSREPTTRDPQAPGTPLWWRDKLEQKRSALLEDRSRWANEKQRLDGLYAIYSYQGRANASSDEAKAWFDRIARTAYARVVIHSFTNKIRMLGAQTDNPVVDRKMQRNMTANGGFFRRATEYAALYGRSGVLVAPAKAPGLPPVAEALDPRFFSWSVDPADDRRLRAFVKYREDTEFGVKTQHLFLPGDPDGFGEEAFDRVYVFRKENTRSAEWAIDPNLSGPLPDYVQGLGIPVIPMWNRDQRGEFEWALDVLERIEDGIRNRLYTTKSQAFRAIMISGLPKTDPATGLPIDYREVLQFDPGGVSLVPNTDDGKGPEVWESQVTDIRPLLDAEKSDVRELAVVTGTSMAQLMPDTNQSAEGAKNAREAADSKALDAITEWTPAAAAVHRLMLAYDNVRLPDDTNITPVWDEVTPQTELEQWQTAREATTAGMALETVMREVLGWTQTQMDAANDDIRKKEALARLNAAREARAASTVVQAEGSTTTPNPTGTQTSSE